MKQGSTLFLKAAVILSGIAVLALCIFVLPGGLSKDVVGGYTPIVIGMYVTVIPFFVAVHQALKLLSYIDTNKAFSDLSVKALTTIKYCALIIGALYVIGLPYIYYVADKDDAPGVVVIGLVFAFASLVIATLTAVLQKLLKDALAIKSENDLTV
jgi:hypothetical protein